MVCKSARLAACLGTAIALCATPALAQDRTQTTQWDLPAGDYTRYADVLGAGAVLDGLVALCEEDALVWKPSPLIEALAASGGTFAGWRRA